MINRAPIWQTSTLPLHRHGQYYVSEHKLTNFQLVTRLYETTEQHSYMIDEIKKILRCYAYLLDFMNQTKLRPAKH